MIHISLSPNVRWRDVRLAISLFFSPGRWLKGEAVQQLEAVFRDRWQTPFALATSSGRTALYSILKALGIGVGDEVLLQASTCNAVSNPILAVGATPVYVDIDPQTYNMDGADLERKITPRARLIVVQHTFGRSANNEEINNLARAKNLLVVEDCAHSLGARHNGQPSGTFGDAAFFSFGRDKVISSVFGGMIITNDRELASRIQKFLESFANPKRCWVAVQLLHPILTKTLILPLYNVFGLGKMLLVILQEFGVLSKAVRWEEKQGRFSPTFLVKIPNALAELARIQLQALDAFNARRKEIARFYQSELQNLPLTLPPWDEECIWLRYPIRTSHAAELIRASRNHGIVLGDWYQSPVDPPDTKLEAVGYELGSCPVAERVCKEVVNLPTYPIMSQYDVERVVAFLRQFFS